MDKLYSIKDIDDYIVVKYYNGRRGNNIIDVKTKETHYISTFKDKIVIYLNNHRDGSYDCLECKDVELIIEDEYIIGLNITLENNKQIECRFKVYRIGECIKIPLYIINGHSLYNKIKNFFDVGLIVKENDCLYDIERYNDKVFLQIDDGYGTSAAFNLLYCIEDVKIVENGIQIKFNDLVLNYKTYSKNSVTIK